MLTDAGTSELARLLLSFWGFPFRSYRRTLASVSVRVLRFHWKHSQTTEGRVVRFVNFVGATRYLVLVPIVGLAIAAAAMFAFGGLGLSV